MKKFICLTIAILIFSMAAFPVFADAGEYNDYTLYDAANNNATVTTGVFYSNNLTPMTSFSLYVDDVANTWNITDGSSVNVPKPTGKRIGDMSSAYITVNGIRYNFTHITQTDTWYISGIPAASNYPRIYIYIPFVTDTSNTKPPTPTLTISGDVLSWTPTGYGSKILYSTDGSQYNVYRNYVAATESSLQIQLEESAYFRIQLYNTELTQLSDTSNRVEFTYVAPDPEVPSDDKTVWDHLSDILDGITNASRVTRNFLREMKAFFYTLFSWLPPEVMTVFWAVVIIGLVVGILIK